MKVFVAIVAVFVVVESSTLPKLEGMAANSTSSSLAKLTKDLLPDVGDEDRQYTWNQLVFDELIR